MESIDERSEEPTFTHRVPAKAMSQGYISFRRDYFTLMVNLKVAVPLESDDSKRQFREMYC